MKHSTHLIMAVLLFSGSLLAQADNDYCNNRQGINEGYTYFNNTQATVSQGWSADCWEVEEEASLWFQFITPAYPASLTLEITADSLYEALDTQIAITSQGCGSEYLYCNENGGPGLQAALYLNCGELEENTAYIFVVNSSYAAAGAGFINLQFDGSCGDSLIYGCLDPVALNYNPFVNVDDGSCYYWADSLALYGCTDPLALNFDTLALYDDGSCVYDIDSTDVYGCTDFMALNYDPLATINDGTCVYDNDSTDVYGCTDAVALNYNPNATLDDGSCYYQVDSTQFYGCTDNFALNYDPSVIWDDGSCQYSDSLGGGYGCTDPFALNYDQEATNDDGSCLSVNCNAEFTISEIDQVNNVIYIVNSSSTTSADDLIYYWNFGDGSTSSDAYPTHTYAENGEYVVCLTVLDSLYDCWSSTCDTLTFFGFTSGSNGEAGVFNNGFTINVLNPQAMGVEEIDFLSGLSVFPNPSNGNMRISLSSLKAQALDMIVTDAMGREVWSKQMDVQKGELQITLELESLTEGLYLFSLRSEEAIETRSILIAR